MSGAAVQTFGEIAPRHGAGLLDGDLAFTVAGLTAHALSAPLERPMRNAFGAIAARPGLVVEIRLADGAHGTGEVFCNFPGFSHLHKKRIVEEILAPILTGRTFQTPGAMSDWLAAAVHKIALQAGEPGPFAHAVAGLDVAAWDAGARRAGTPLWRLMSADGTAHAVPAYASGIDGADIDALVPGLRAEGWRAYKLKVGFGTKEDTEHLARLRAAAGAEARLMVDANQAWDFPTAERRIAALAREGLEWIEEPVPADRPVEEWRVLADIGPPIAAGENLRGHDAFASAIEAGVTVIQPDIIKWGGLSGVRAVALAAKAAGVHWAPHYLAGGLGLAASAHLAVACGALFLEHDVNPNPLRGGLLGGALSIEDGMVRLADRPGHGATPDPDVLSRYRAA